MPTEAEWERACRAGTAGPRYGPLDEIAWHRGNSRERIHHVGARRHWSCRACVRRRSHPTFRVDVVGFRVARSLARAWTVRAPTGACASTSGSG
ncbi:SUMF1/EgtB/PvdO family nonheme iron enzyme [Streptomyces sp. NPDC002088]|uniref:SUMF1/EgtB/PvdO family nonheme iron enzyme n=1 Tax=Streptomyces sp. NPDC002088 TaxID=3154665 RepID=UPI0033215A9D